MLTIVRVRGEELVELHRGGEKLKYDFALCVFPHVGASSPARQPASFDVATPSRPYRHAIRCAKDEKDDKIHSAFDAQRPQEIHLFPQVLARFIIPRFCLSVRHTFASREGILMERRSNTAGDLPIHLHSLPHFNLVRTFNGHTAGISEIAFSADSAFLASASDDHTIRIWQIDNVVAAGENVGGEGRGDSSLRVLRGHTTSVFCVAWNPRGDLVASGGMDETVRIWDVQKGSSAFSSGSKEMRLILELTGRCMKVLPAHSDPVSGVQFNRDGTMIVSGSWDGYMYVLLSSLSSPR